TSSSFSPRRSRSTTSSFLFADHRLFDRKSAVPSSFTVMRAILAPLYSVSNFPGCAPQPHWPARPFVIAASQRPCRLWPLTTESVTELAGQASLVPVDYSATRSAQPLCPRWGPTVAIGPVVDGRPS